MVSGLFYPSSAEELAIKIDALMKGAEINAGTCSTIICPHASINYSGDLAAKAWKAASARQVRTIVLVSPSHRSFEPGLYLPESQLFSIPTCSFNVDKSSVKNLLHSNTNLSVNDIPHLEEHAIEVQLIYAAHFFPNARILPIIICGADEASLDSLFSNLHFIFGEKLDSTLFVLTSNMAVDDNAENCLKKTTAFAECIAKKELELLKTFIDTQPSFCGGRIIAAYMRSQISEGQHPAVFGIGSSAAFAEADEPIVGYAAIGFSG
jgi:MEMO1 family protein